MFDNSKKQNLYCFVDETGQDTKGQLFLVTVILHSKDQLITLRAKLEQIERGTKKNYLKWVKTPLKIKQAYLLELLKVKELHFSIFYSQYHSTTEYYPLVSLTIAKSILFQQVKSYQATIVIDGLNSSERGKVTNELKRLGIKYRKIRGMKDEQEVLLRLADAMAGFLRDCTEHSPYTKKTLPLFLGQKIVVEV